jgi:hypothetical protein
MSMQVKVVNNDPEQTAIVETLLSLSEGGQVEEVGPLSEQVFYLEAGRSLRVRQKETGP